MADIQGRIIGIVSKLILVDFCLGPVYLLGSVQEVARFRDVSRRAAPDSEGRLETKAHPDTQGE